MDNSDERRDALHDFLQHQGPETDGAEGALLTGWVVALEWVDTNGDRWLSRAYASTTSPWNAKGMMHECLHGEWPEPDDDDGDDE